MTELILIADDLTGAADAGAAFAATGFTTAIPFDRVRREARPAWLREAGPAAYAEGLSVRPPLSEAFSVPRRTPFGRGENILCDKAFTKEREAEGSG